jgi:hypothetical protein
MCFDFLYDFLKTFLIIRIIQRNIIFYVGLHVEIPVIIIRLTWNVIFFRQSFRMCSVSDFMKNRPVGAELFHTDRHDEASSRFLEFCERA